MNVPHPSLPLVLPLVAVVVAACLGAAVLLSPRPKPGPPAVVPAPVELRAVAVLREAGTWVSLATLAEATGETPGTIALALAGHPGAEDVTTRSGSRWYRLTAP